MVWVKHQKLVHFKLITVTLNPFLCRFVECAGLVFRPVLENAFTLLFFFPDNRTNSLKFQIFVCFMCHRENIFSAPPNCLPILLLSSRLSLHLVRLLSISARTTGDLVYLLSFLGIKAVAITHCQLYGTPETPHPSPLLPTVCVFFSQDAHDGCGEEGGVGTESVCECAYGDVFGEVGDREWAEVPAVLICTAAGTPTPNKAPVSAHCLTWH